MFRHTDAQFQTSTFGQVSSGSACAAILWLELYSVTHDAGLLQLIERALRFVAGSQLANATNPELLNAVVENSNAPGRTDASPYHLRDIASSFYVQAISMLLTAAAGTREADQAVVGST